MTVFTFIKNKLTKRNRRRKRGVDKFTRIAQRKIFTAAANNPLVLAAILAKYCNIWVYDDVSVKADRQKIVDIIYEEAERMALTEKRGEVDKKIINIINRLIAICTDGDSGQNTPADNQLPTEGD